MTADAPEPFDVHTEVAPGEKRHLRHGVGETYLGDPVELPVTIVNGEHDGPRLCLTAAIHGDELNGVKVCQEVATMVDPADLHGTLVIVHVVNVPAYHAQTRYIPIYDQDLNRCFPGRAAGNTADRMAHEVYASFVEPCDLLIDFHTSTRNRTTMYHVRADTSRPEVDRLARAFAANVVLAGDGEEGSLRTEATTRGIPAITVEMGKAHRFQPALIDRAVAGVESVLAEYGLRPDGAVSWPGWHREMGAADEKRWIRADAGGLVDMEWGPYPLVHEGETICTVTDHFRRNARTVTAPFTGLIVGVLENPLALPGHPLCHLVRVDPTTRDVIEAQIERGTFVGYPGGRWLGDNEEAE